MPRGISKANSISKIRKIKVVKKNRTEKGVRAFLKGENPHSKGVIFSRSLFDFSEVNNVIIINKADIVIDIKNIKIKIDISNFINK